MPPEAICSRWKLQSRVYFTEDRRVSINRRLQSNPIGSVIYHRAFASRARVPPCQIPRTPSGFFRRTLPPSVFLSFFSSSSLSFSVSLFPTIHSFSLLFFPLLFSPLLSFARPLRRRETARSSSGGKKYSAQYCAPRAEAAARFTCRFREIADSAKLRAARASNDEFSRRGESEIPVFSTAFVVNRPTGLPRVTKGIYQIQRR